MESRAARVQSADGRDRAKKGLFEGDLEEGYMEAGEVAGEILLIIPMPGMWQEE